MAGSRLASECRAAAPLTAPSPRLVDEDAAHGLGRGGEEVSTVVEARRSFALDEAQVRLVHQGGRVQGLPRLLVGQPLRRQPAQLVVDQG